MISALLRRHLCVALVLASSAVSHGQLLIRCTMPNGCIGYKNSNGDCGCGGVSPGTCAYLCTPTGDPAPTPGNIICDGQCNIVACTNNVQCTDNCGQSADINVCIYLPNDPPRTVYRPLVLNGTTTLVPFPDYNHEFCLPSAAPFRVAETCNGIDDNCDGTIDEGVCDVPTGCACVPVTCSTILASGVFPDGCGGYLQC